MGHKQTSHEERGHLRLVVDNDGGSSRDRPRVHVSQNDELAEAEVISAMLMNAEGRAVAKHMLTPQCFYHDDLRHIFIAIVSCDDDGALGQPEDAVVTVVGWLRDREVIQRVGGARRIGELLDSVPATAQVERLCRRLIDLRRLRRVAKLVHRVGAEVYTREASHDPQKWLQDVASAFQHIADDAPEVEIATAGSAVEDADAWVMRAHSGDKSALGLELPLKELQKKTTGLYLGETLVITAKTGGGKTLLAGTISKHVAKETMFAAGWWSLEMPKRQLISRMACADAEVSAHALRAGRLNDEDLLKYRMALHELKALPLFFDEHRPRRGWRTVESVLSTMNRYKQSCEQKLGRPLGLMVLDFVQLLDCSGVASRRANREQQLNLASYLLVREAERLGIALILLCQTNEDGQIREAKSVSHHAHAWWRLTISKDRFKNWNGSTQIQKARHGGTGKVDFGYDPQSVRFHD